MCDCNICENFYNCDMTNNPPDNCEFYIRDFELFWNRLDDIEKEEYYRDKEGE